MQPPILEVHQVQVFLKQHVIAAINELVEAERELEMHSNARDDAELVTQIRYLCSHIAGLGKDLKIASEGLLLDHVLQSLKAALMKSNGQYLANLFLSFGDNLEPVRTFPTTMRASPISETRMSLRTNPTDQRLINLTLQNVAIDPIRNLALPELSQKAKSVFATPGIEQPQPLLIAPPSEEESLLPLQIHMIDMQKNFAADEMTRTKNSCTPVTITAHVQPHIPSGISSNQQSHFPSINPSIKQSQVSLAEVPPLRLEETTQKHAATHFIGTQTSLVRLKS